MNQFFKDVMYSEKPVYRALRTFFQAAVCFVGANLAGLKYESFGTFFSTLISLLGAAAAAGICEVWHSIIKPKLEKKEDENGTDG